MVKKSNGIVRMLIPFGVVCAAFLYIIGLTFAQIAESIDMIKIYKGYIGDANFSFEAEAYRQSIAQLSGFIVFYIILAALAAVALVAFAIYFVRTVSPRVKAVRLAAKEGSAALFPAERVGAWVITCYCLVFVALLVGIYMMVSNFQTVYQILMINIETIDIDNRTDIYYANIRGYVTHLVVYIVGTVLSAAAAVCCAVRFVHVYAEDKKSLTA